LFSGQGATGCHALATDASLLEPMMEVSIETTSLTATATAIEIEEVEGESDAENEQTKIEEEKGEERGEKKEEEKEEENDEKKMEKKEKEKFYEKKKKRKTGADVLAATIEQMSEDANMHFQALLSAKRSRVEELTTARMAKILNSNYY
jgi:archaellum component FlaD/FlaE